MTEQPGSEIPDNAQRIGRGWTLTLALWGGLAGGLLEAADFAKKRYLDGALIQNMPDDVLWAAPVADVSLCLVLGLVLLALGRLVPGAAHPRVALTVFVTFACLAPLLWLHSIAWWGAAVLALGIGITVGRIAAKRWRLTRRLILVTTPLFALTVLVAAMALSSHRSRAAESAAGERSPAAPGSPNVLLVVLDTVRSSHMSLHGYGRETTPALEEWAADATVFENAIATTSWTLPTHVSLLTGRYRHETHAHWRGPMSPDTPTLAEWFDDRGYRTAGLVGNLVYCDRAFDFDRGFERYEDFDMHVGQILHTSKPVSSLVKAVAPLVGYRDLLWRKSAEGMIERGLDWIDEDDDRPWFVFFNFYDAHGPYLPPQRLRDRFGPTDALRSYHSTYDTGPSHERATYSDVEMEAAVNAYDAAILYLDEQLAALLDQLEQRGILENTIVIVTSDHGEEFGEHDAVGHGVNLYDETVRVPLIVRYPRHVPREKRVWDPVTLRDVPATIQKLVAPDAAPTLPGLPLHATWGEDPDAPAQERSLVITQLNHATHHPAWSIASQGAAYGVYVDGFSVLLNGDGSAEVYDRAADPGQTHDLAETDAGQERVRSTRALLRERGVIEGE